MEEVMGIYKERYNNEWRAVKGDFKKEACICPRCRNKVEYTLCYDGDGIGFPGFLTLKYNKIYAYKCPICPNYEDVSPELAKAIINGGQ